MDVPLTSRGEEEARQAGALIRSKGLKVDLAFTSFLKRAANTCELVLESLDQTGIPIHADWRLNERHYGALSGLNKSETLQSMGSPGSFVEAKLLGKAQSYDTPITLTSRRSIPNTFRQACPNPISLLPSALLTRSCV